MTKKELRKELLNTQRQVFELQTRIMVDNFQIEKLTADNDHLLQAINGLKLELKKATEKSSKKTAKTTKKASK